MHPIRTPKAFGSAVRRERTNQGLTQAELAKRAGVGRPWLSELESGKRTVELGRALLVLSALGMAVNFAPIPNSTSRPVDLRQIIGEGA